MGYNNVNLCWDLRRYCCLACGGFGLLEIWMFSRWNHGVFASFISLKVEESETFLKFQEVKTLGAQSNFFN